MVVVFTAEFGGGLRLASVNMAGVGLSPAALMVQLLLLLLPQRLKDEGSSKGRAAVDGAARRVFLQDCYRIVCVCAHVSGAFVEASPIWGKTKCLLKHLPGPLTVSLLLRCGEGGSRQGGAWC